MADETRIAELIINRLKQTLSEAEKEELEAWIAASPDHQLFLDTRVTPEAVAENLKNMAGLNEGSLDKKIRDRIGRSIVPSIQPPTRSRLSKKTIWLRVAGIRAACIITAVVIQFYVTPIPQPVRFDFTPY